MTAKSMSIMSGSIKKGAGGSKLLTSTTDAAVFPQRVADQTISKGKDLMGSSPTG